MSRETIDAPDLSRRSFLLRSEMPAPSVAVAQHCLALSGVYCDSCRDACETGALRFTPQLGAVPKPALDTNLCTQCGECARLCPQDAIRIRPLTGDADHD
ncbi:MAG: 4Fe-4S binding protein [Betaproteobacteria bacterium]|nr:4Fe-4S binding protein [Betaproteobacteria bacterium]